MSEFRGAIGLLLALGSLALVYFLVVRPGLRRLAAAVRAARRLSRLPLFIFQVSGAFIVGCAVGTVGSATRAGHANMVSPDDVARSAALGFFLSGVIVWRTTRRLERQEGLEAAESQAQAVDADCKGCGESVVGRAIPHSSEGLYFGEPVRGYFCTSCKAAWCPQCNEARVLGFSWWTYQKSQCGSCGASGHNFLTAI
jgi:hypothetical protein